MKRKRKFLKLFSQINRSEEKKFKTEKKKTQEWRTKFNDL